MYRSAAARYRLAVHLAEEARKAEVVAPDRTRRLAEAQCTVDSLRMARNVAAVEETRCALELIAAPTTSDRDALEAARDRAVGALILLGADYERAVRHLFAVLAESPAGEMEIGDPLAGFTTVIDPMSGALCTQRETA